jgi:hypothetical protein
VAVGALVLLAATQAGCTPKAQLTVSAQEDVLGLTTRLVFSTNHNSATAPRSVTLTNGGSSAIDVTALTLGGQNPSQFALADGQPATFTIDPNGGTATVSDVFAPTSTGNKFATLTLENSSSTPQYVVSLRGVSARGTLGNTEPKLSQLMQLFGYTTDVGFSANHTATTRAPLGDEVVAPYFVRADSSQPVSLIPIARYTGVNTSVTDNGRTPENSSAKTSLFKFPGDAFADDTPGDGVDESIYTENQKVWPQIQSGSLTFEPTAPFGFYEAGTNYSDDRWNVDDSGLTYRNIRVYPAKDANGAAIPNTWLLGLDVKTGDADKNYDYQDQVLLLRNAKPERDPGPAPGSAATALSFDSPVDGTVVDKDGEGTGFTSTQPNKNGTQAHPELIDLTNGTLQITSTAGKSSGPENLQDDALQVNFDGSRTDSFAQTRIEGPMTGLTSGSQQKAVFFGPDQDNYLKIEVEHRTTPTEGVFLTAFREQAGVTATIGQVQLTDPASVVTLDLGIRADLETGALQGVYRVNSDGDWTELGTPFAPSAVLRFFSPQAEAGVLVSHTGSTTPIVGVFDSFSVTVP